MDKKKIFIITSIIIGVIFSVLYIKKKDNDNELMSGGLNTHMYHCEGVISEKSDELKMITVELDSMKSQNHSFNFNSSKVQLDYSEVQYMDEVNVGNTIIFYFFKWNIKDTNIKVQNIYLKENN